VQEYQVDVDPDAMRVHGVTLEQVFAAVKMSNVDVGARTIEVNRVEYVIRGLGFIKNNADIENIVVRMKENVPLYVKDVARVAKGPALRRGALDKEGAEAVGAVAVVRYGYNPLKAINNLKKKIEQVQPGLHTKAVIDFDKVTRGKAEKFARSHGFDAYLEGGLNQEAWLSWLAKAKRQDWPAWVTTSQVTIVPFYDRTGLIYETLGTLDSALTEEIFVTIIVVLVSVLHLRSSLLISSSLPLAVLVCFIAMKMFGVDANIVALSGIAIAIGTIVDMGIIICENTLRHLDDAGPDEDRLEVVYRASSEVGGAVLTAVATTVVSFLPVFTMTGAEGKLFKPLAFTKTFALVASVIVALTIIPPAAHALFTWNIRGKLLRKLFFGGLVAAGVVLAIAFGWWLAGGVLALIGAYYLARDYLPDPVAKSGPLAATAIAVLLVGIMLAQHWLPLGPEKGFVRNFVFVAASIGGLLLFFHLFQRVYGDILRWFLAHKIVFCAIPLLLVMAGATVWLGFPAMFGFVPRAAKAVGADPAAVRETTFWVGMSQKFPGLGKEFMPPLDEGSYLLMPTTMPHASIGECLDVLQKQDMAIRSIPEVETVVGKIGRVESPLDPAPISMIETVITYRSEYMTDKDGHRIRFAYDNERDAFVRGAGGDLVSQEKAGNQPVRRGDGGQVNDISWHPYRQWRDHVKRPDDIWNEIVKAARVPGTTSAPKLQPIAARIVMLQSGMRAPMGVKVRGDNLEKIEQVGLQLEKLLKEVPSVEAATVVADRIVGKPYLEIDIDRRAIARYGIHVRKVQDVIEVAVGGRQITTTVEGRERYPVRVRYMRELRDQIESLMKILVPAQDGMQVPLSEVATIKYVRGPQVIKGEDTKLVGYVVFDKKPGFAEVDVVEACQRYLTAKRESGEFSPPDGINYEFAGNYENQIRAQRRLAIVLPVALFVIFIILYFQFKSIPTTLLVFSGIVVAWAGGFLLIWLYNQPWFMDFSVFGTNLRNLFQMPPVNELTGEVIESINLSVAVWVGFLALFGIASDNGVVIATYLNQSFAAREPGSIEEIREAVVAGAVRRIRPCLMTSATTVLALIPVLTSVGRGSDVMVPMAIPSFGGMLVVLVSVFVVPVLYCLVKEFRKHSGISDGALGAAMLMTGFLALVPMLIYCSVKDARARSTVRPSN